MTALELFGLESTKRFLQSVVFVDDEIYESASGKPGEVSVPLTPFKPPFALPSNSGSSTASSEEAAPVLPATYHPRQLVESFAGAGIVCALYEPQEGFKTDASSELFKLCDRADIVILDWDLYKEDGSNILPLICNLANSGQSSVPHHVRLCVIYTTKPDLERVASQIYDRVHADGALKGVEVIDKFTVVTGATRIVVLGKPDVGSRPQEAKSQEVKEADLASRVILEFARMNSGLLPSYALNAMAEVRRNTKRVIDKFDKGLDAPFLVNRALVIGQEEAFDQLPELLSEELLAVIQDSPIQQATIDKLVAEYCESIPMDATKITWQVVAGRPAVAAETLARRFLVGGSAAIKDDFNYKGKSSKNTDILHAALGCNAHKTQEALAALFAVRTNYGATPPALQLGTIIRSKEDGSWVYSVCLQPLCDGVRLSRDGVGYIAKFPFWKLTPDRGGYGIVVKLPGVDDYCDLFADGKPRERLSIEAFQAGANGVVSAVGEKPSFLFGGKFEWVAQLKPVHAQRIAFDVGRKLSRVGLIEAEWLRQRAEGSER